MSIANKNWVIILVHNAASFALRFERQNILFEPITCIYISFYGLYL